MTQVLDRVCGFCVVYNSPSERPAGEGREVIAPGALTAARSVFANVWHSARTSFAGTLTQSLQLTFDRHGVFMRADIAATREGAAVRDMLRNNSRQQWGMSPRLNILEVDELDDEEGRPPLTRILRAEIEHVALGTSPIFPATSCWLESTGPLTAHDAAAERRWRINLDLNALALGRAAGPAEPINLDTEAMRWARDNSARAASLARGRLQ